MGPDAGRNIRNAVILLALAAIVWGLPGGRTGSQTVANLLSIIFLAGLGFFAYRAYMENRITLLDLEDRTRGILYGSFALVAFALVATGRLTRQSGVGVLIWMGLMAMGVYGMYFVYRATREY